MIGYTLNWDNLKTTQIFLLPENYQLSRELVWLKFSKKFMI